MLSEELARFQNNFVENSFPAIRVIEHKIRRFKESLVLEHSRCTIYLKLPWLARKLQLLADRISACINSWYDTGNLHTVFHTRSVFPCFNNDRLYYFQNSYVIYNFKYRCEAVYIVWTNQRLETHIMQHVLVYLRASSQSCLLRTTQSIRDSSIEQHLLDNPDCVEEFNEMFFLILHKTHSVHQFSRLCTSNFTSLPYASRKIILSVPHVCSGKYE